MDDKDGWLEKLKEFRAYLLMMKYIFISIYTIYIRIRIFFDQNR